MKTFGINHPCFNVCLFLILALGSDAQNINQSNIMCPGGVHVNSFNGNMNMQRTDLFIAGRKFDLDMTFYYSSFDCRKNLGYGNGWRFEYLMQCIPDSNGVEIVWPGGRTDHFIGDSTTNVYAAPAGIFDSLSHYQPGKFVLITKNKIKYFFDNAQHKRLTRMEEPNGNAMTFTYTDSLITLVTDASGRSLQLAYAGGKLTSITDALASPVRIVQYAYDANGNLTEVTDPAGEKRKYSYIVNGPMKTVTDKNDNVVDIIYQSNFAVKEVITCITDQRITYNTNAHSTYLVETVESGNHVTIYEYNNKGRLLKQIGNCCGYNISMEYDNNNNIVSYTDANNNKYEMLYDNKSNPVSIKDPLENTMHYTYDAVFNKVSSFTDQNGNITSFTYDSNGNLTQVSYPLGVTNSYTYATNGDLISKANGNGNVTTYNYDSNGNLVAIHKPLGVNKAMTYNGRSHKISYIDPRGNTTTYAYDIRNRLISVTDALNHTKTYNYDANSNITSFTDKNGHTTSMSYDALNRIVSITDPMNHSRQFIYNAKSKVISFTNANGITYHYAYDNLNRLISRTNGANETTTFNYDGKGNIISVASPDGNTVNLSYDAMNRVTQASDNIGLLFTLGYDNKGNLHSVSDANGNSNSFSYDALNRKISATDALGNSSQFAYDNNFNLFTYTDKNNHTSSYTYDALDRLTDYTDAGNNVSFFTYDAAGNLTAATDANGHNTTYSYDALNRNILQTFADGTTNSFTYDAKGKLISRTDNNGAVTSYTYDNDDRLITRNFPGSNDDVFTYDAGGRMITATNNNAVVTFAYDAANRRISETLNGKTTSYSYDIAGRKKSITYPVGRIISRLYDTRKRLIEVRDGSNSIATFNYDISNRIIQKTFGNGVSTQYIYDSKKRLISMFTSPQNIFNFSYTYDKRGNKLTENKLHRPDHSEQYIYDNKYQLTEFKSGTLSGNSIPSPLHQNQYNYDALGNRTSITEDTASSTYTTNSMNAYTNITGALAATPQYDNNGNILNDGNFSYSYDAKNRLLAVNGGAVASYQYDALGRRIRKTVGANIINFFYSGRHEIEFRDNADNTFKTNVYSSGIDHILSARINNLDYYYHYNSQGSVISIEDNAGNIVERYEYDPFGKVNIFDNNYNSLSSSAINNNIFYTGRTLDTEISKYYYRKRIYDAANGRFNQHDPYKYINGLNMYAYTNNNSINMRDPSGACIQDDLTRAFTIWGVSTAGAIIGQILGGILIPPVIDGMSGLIAGIMARAGIGEAEGVLLGGELGGLVGAEEGAIIGREEGAMIGREEGVLLGEEGGAMAGEEGGGLAGEGAGAETPWEGPTEDVLPATESGEGLPATESGEAPIGPTKNKYSPKDREAEVDYMHVYDQWNHTGSDSHLNSRAEFDKFMQENYHRKVKFPKDDPWYDPMLDQ